MPEAQTLIYNRYSILHIERSSNFSKVFFALDTYQNPPRSCAIKVFEPIVQKPQIAEWIGREFQKEAKRLKQLSLNNQHLPQIYTYSNDFQVYYLVRELIEGVTLEEKVQTRKFSPPEVREILVKLLSVLDYIHDRGVIHQNIKPKNIILRDGDNVPMLINFGSIKQIVATYGFYGDRQIFSSNNTHGYAPSEQALGKAVPASDLYSLGLTAVYLLTAQNPVDLNLDKNFGNLQLPSEIVASDPTLAAVITRAIGSNLAERYSCASQMLDALQDRLDLKNLRPSADVNRIATVPSRPQQQLSRASRNRNSSNWWQIIIYGLGILCIMAAGTLIWHDWNLNQDDSAPVLQLPEPSTSPPRLSEPSPVQPRPSMLNARKDSIEIPLFATGTSKQELRKALGEPNAIQKGYWANSTAWIYKERANGSIDLGYLFDLDTDELRQTEVAIAPSVGLETIEEILDSLLQGKLTSPVDLELQKIYNRQEDEYTFRLENLAGSIQRDPDDNIYLGVWQADFH